MSKKTSRFLFYKGEKRKHLKQTQSSFNHLNREGSVSQMHVHLDEFRNLLPLLRPGVHAGGIVGAGMQQNHTLLWYCLS